MAGCCRAGTNSYVLFTLDKLIYKLVKQFQAILADELTQVIGPSTCLCTLTPAPLLVHSTDAWNPLLPSCRAHACSHHVVQPSHAIRLCHTAVLLACRPHSILASMQRLAGVMYREGLLQSNRLNNR